MVESVLAGNSPLLGRTQIYLFEFKECARARANSIIVIPVCSQLMEKFQHLTILGKRATMTSVRCQS